jgi:saccharopine dehydrogenase-like NADP-dependent oxidoreductase
VSLRVGILGTGAVGSRVARQILAADLSNEVVLSDPDRVRLSDLLSTLGPNASASFDGAIHREAVDLIVVAGPAGRHVAPIRRALRAGVPAISTSDRVEDVRALLALDDKAIAAGVPVLAGVGFSPGLTCVLATYAARSFEVVDEVHVAKAGTGGPACARQHHRALKGSARDWRESAWVRRPGGSGRELVWFPDPVSGADCYRGALSEALLLHPYFEQASRITARIAATRQDRFTSWLPMLSPPHAEGGVGAIRVEIRGRSDGHSVVRVVGAVERPASAAAAVVASACEALTSGLVGGPGVRGLAGLADTGNFLRDVLRRGLSVQEFEGSARL